MKLNMSWLKRRNILTVIILVVTLAAISVIPSEGAVINNLQAVDVNPPPYIDGSGAAGQVAFFTSDVAVSSDSSFYWDNINKRLGIGTTAPEAPFHIYSTTSTQPETIDLNGVGPLTSQWNNWSEGGSFSGSGFLARFSRGSKESPTNVAVGDRLGFNVFGGWAGAWKHTAAIEAMVDSGTVSTTSLPTYLKFSTTPDGSTTRVERLRINADGKVGINTTAQYAKLEVMNTSSADVAAIMGGSNNITGVYGFSDNQYGVFGYSHGGGVGVYGASPSGSGVIGYSVTGQAGYFAGNTTITGNLNVNGTKNFVTVDPSDHSKEIYYAALEGPEAGTYLRGSGELVDGQAIIELPAHFADVTAEEGLTVQLTPVGKWLQLYVIEKSTTRIVVGEAGEQSGSFDFIINGVRKGYEDYQVVRDATTTPDIDMSIKSGDDFNTFDNQYSLNYGIEK